MEATRRGFLKTAIGTSLLGLFWPEKVKTEVKKFVDDGKPADGPHMPSTPLPDPYLHDMKDVHPGVDPALTKLQQDLEKLKQRAGQMPAPHEGPGAYCPFTGMLYTEGQCPCAQCGAARQLYWEQVARERQFRRYTYGGPTIPFVTAQSYMYPVTGYISSASPMTSGHYMAQGTITTSPGIANAVPNFGGYMPNDVPEGV